LNVYSQIGLITLVGLITKHGILIVEFANQLRANGLTALDAVHRAATLRLRPILMTSLAMIAGMIPMALAKSQTSPLSIATIGGLALATVATLLVLPAVYALLASSHAKSASLEPDEATA
jgi:multidrug efflux pump